MSKNLICFSADKSLSKLTQAQDSFVLCLDPGDDASFEVVSALSSVLDEAAISALVRLTEVCPSFQVTLAPLKSPVYPKSSETVSRKEGDGTFSSVLPEVSIYTDGSCSGNPGPGGWGAIILRGKEEQELSGGEQDTTNNRMELQGVISALYALDTPCRVQLYTDSQYLANAVNKHWLDKWQNNGWLTTSGEPVLNRDLWEQLLTLFKKHEVTVSWVKGHADNPYNNRCDKLAVAQTRAYSKQKTGKG